MSKVGPQINTYQIRCLQVCSTRTTAVISVRRGSGESAGAVSSVSITTCVCLATWRVSTIWSIPSTGGTEPIPVRKYTAPRDSNRRLDKHSKITPKSEFVISNPQSANLNNFHPLEVVYRYRDPQLQVGENCAYFSNLN